MKTVRGMLLLSMVLPALALAGGDVGDVATDFQCFDSRGEYHNLYDYWGEIILLNFFAEW